MDLAPREPGTGRQAELPLHIVGGVEQYATGLIAVSSSATRFLKVVLEGARDGRVDDQPHVRLVDAHAEGVGGDDHPQFAIDEAPLHVLSGFGRHAGMKVVGGEVFRFQKLRDFLRLPARGAVDDGTARRIRRQIGHENPVNAIRLRAPGRRHHDELQIGAVGTAVEDGEFNAEPVAKVLPDVLHHVRLGRGGQAQHRRRLPGRAFRMSDGAIGRLLHALPDEAPDVAVVRAEVVAPAGQTMGFVQHPGADLALLERSAHGPTAKLLRRNNEDSRSAQAHFVQRRSPLGQGQQAIDRHAGIDVVPLQSRHLVRHERHQGRDHDGQGALS